MTPLHKARTLALAVPLLLMAGALGSQYIGGLYPCEMCHWQRWPHEIAIVVALFAFALTERPDASRAMTALAAVAIMVSGGIGVFHAGVEYGWWQGLTTCSTAAPAGGSDADILANIWATPVIRCDQAQWDLFGISLAGFNAIFSIGAGLLILALLARRGTAAR
ncbi:MAG: disulfide bond formation protein DsbB [Sphingomonas sp. SCN 67-18]|uniref:disulfide bond formation protein B n=1 Tax=uncultured Sphingomonas sp. TaxID=158754 RepID=UPI00086AC743|nr:disulfide bond formation protein B [Sphingomonas sp. SCN 67-18]ODU21737.1 MAG: disulfide bond formation protein DsbB [Sphingomonas sp. SCN 67-18]